MKHQRSLRKAERLSPLIWQGNMDPWEKVHQESLKEARTILIRKCHLDCLQLGFCQPVRDHHPEQLKRFDLKLIQGFSRSSRQCDKVRCCLERCLQDSRQLVLSLSQFIPSLSNSKRPIIQRASDHLQEQPQLELSPRYWVDIWRQIQFYHLKTLYKERKTSSQKITNARPETSLISTKSLNWPKLVLNELRCPWIIYQIRYHSLHRLPEEPSNHGRQKQWVITHLYKLAITSRPSKKKLCKSPWLFKDTKIMILFPRLLQISKQPTKNTTIWKLDSLKPPEWKIWNLTLTSQLLMMQKRRSLLHFSSYLQIQKD